MVWSVRPAHAQSGGPQAAEGDLIREHDLAPFLCIPVPIHLGKSQPLSLHFLVRSHFWAAFLLGFLGASVSGGWCTPVLHHKAGHLWDLLLDDTGSQAQIFPHILLKDLQGMTFYHGRVARALLSLRNDVLREGPRLYHRHRRLRRNTSGASTLPRMPSQQASYQILPLFPMSSTPCASFSSY